MFNSPFIKVIKRTLSSAELFGLGTSANATVEPPERNALFVFYNILQILLSPPEGHVLNGACRLMSVL